MTWRDRERVEVAVVQPTTESRDHATVSERRQQDMPNWLEGATTGGYHVLWRSQPVERRGRFHEDRHVVQWPEQAGGLHGRAPAEFRPEAVASEAITQSPEGTLEPLGGPPSCFGGRVPGTGSVPGRSLR